jgi:selenocysteine-specific elongation factor
MFVIGTAGHVDHGKSALVEALTGIDPDRLAEEKARGMTIDLGFAWLRLPGGLEVSIVDVPGHERFIKNMLAGVGGIDLALLVVAADEGVMPQTREHLDILDLLGVSRGVLVLTKADLVERDWLDLVAEEVREAVKGTTLAGAPLLACSAVTREGLDGLLAAIEAALAETPPKRDLGRPRLPIDRAFTVAGFGAVVTGTLIDGALDVGQEVEVLPAMAGGHLTALRSRVRGLQTHRTKVERALPGTRAAVNLAGLEAAALSRGQVVATPGWLRPAMAVDVRLRVLPSLRRPLRHNLGVTFHTGASETPARLRLLESDEAPPGSEAWAQLRLRQPVALVSGDRFVLRDANATLGGGVIVDANPRRHPRGRPSVIEALERRGGGSPEESLLAALAASEPTEAAALFARTDLSPQTATAALAALVAAGRVVELAAAEGAPAYYTRESFERLGRRAVEAVTAYLQREPLRRGLGREELRSRLGLNSRLFPAALAAWGRAGLLAESGGLVSPPDWSPRLTAAQRQAADAYLERLRSSPYAPPADGRPDPRLLAYLVEAGEVVDVGAGVIFAADAYQRLVDGVVELIRSNGKVTLAEVRDRFATTRKYVQALLEHLDREKVTLRVGDERVLGRAARRAP